MGTIRQYTPEFSQSAVNLVLVEGLSARKAAENLGIPMTGDNLEMSTTTSNTSPLLMRTSLLVNVEFNSLARAVACLKLFSQNTPPALKVSPAHLCQTARG